MQTQSETANSRKSTGNRTPARASQSQRQTEKQEFKSVGEVIGESLGEDTQKQIEQVLTQASDYLETGRKYVRENRGEALALAVAAGVAGWALFYTKPGRQIFEMAAPKILPQISNFVSEVLGQNTQSSRG